MSPANEALMSFRFVVEIDGIRTIFLSVEFLTRQRLELRRGMQRLAGERPDRSLYEFDGCKTIRIIALDFLGRAMQEWQVHGASAVPGTYTVGPFGDDGVLIERLICEYASMEMGAGYVDSPLAPNPSTAL